MSTRTKFVHFLAKNEAALVACCVAHMKAEYPEMAEREAALFLHFKSFVDEVIRALHEHEGTPAEVDRAAVPLDAAHQTLELELSPAALVPTYTLLSVAVGEIGSKEDTSFSAEEYLVFNQTIDKHVALAIEEVAVASRLALGRDLGFLAHELRNALSSALMAYRVLERGDVPMRGRTADTLLRNLLRMERIIEDALRTATIEGGPLPKLRETDLAAVFHELEESAVLERGIRVFTEGSEGIRVMADDRLLVSALSNLVQNGIKFSHDAATIVVRAKADERTAVIEIEDECGGLPPGKTEELFQPFVQGSRASRRGVGLGLTIAREAVRVLQGEITVRDFPGKGCVFAIRLPRAT